MTLSPSYQEGFRSETGDAKSPRGSWKWSCIRSGSAFGHSTLIRLWKRGPLLLQRSLGICGLESDAEPDTDEGNPHVAQMWHAV